MSQKSGRLYLLLLGFLLFLVILDSRTAVNAANESIQLCLKTVVPSIFPFLFLSGAIAEEIGRLRIPLLERLLHIQPGTAAYFLVGQLCGYPVGAKLLQNAMDQQTIDKQSAARMVSFCNNASPAFIIGIMTPLFSNGWIAIALWLIQVISSLLLGMVLPHERNLHPVLTTKRRTDLGKTMLQSLKATATICGWIILFGIVLAYLKGPVFSKLNTFNNAMLSGALELTNGIFLLGGISVEPLRFTAGAVLLSLGGVCIFLQTKSVAPFVDMRAYLFARLIHAVFSGTIATLSGFLLFTGSKSDLRCVPLLVCAGIICCLILSFNKKVVAINRNL